MSAKQILLAAAGSGPPPSLPPEFSGGNFDMFGFVTLPGYMTFNSIVSIEFSGFGTVNIYNTLNNIPANGPMGWDTLPIDNATTGVTFNVSSVSITPTSGTPFVQVWDRNNNSLTPGSYIIDYGGGGINNGAILGLQLVLNFVQPGDATQIVINGTVDLVDVATRSTIFSSINFNIFLNINFI